MQNRIRMYVENEVKQYKFKNRGEVIDEISSNLAERYNELISSGMNTEDAYKETIALTGSFALLMVNDLSINPLYWYIKTLMILLLTVLTGVVSMFFFSPIGYFFFASAFIYFTFELSKLELNGRNQDNIESEGSKHKRNKSIIKLLYYASVLLVISFSLAIWDLFFRLLLDSSSISVLDWLTKITPLWFVIIMFITSLLLGMIIIGYPLLLAIMSSKSTNDGINYKIQISIPEKKMKTKLISKSSFSFSRTFILFITMNIILIMILISKVQVYDLIPSLDFQGELILVDSIHFWVYLFEDGYYHAILPIYIVLICSLIIGVYLLITKNFSLKLWFSLYIIVITGLIISQVLLLFVSEYRISLHIPLSVTVIGFIYLIMHSRFIGVVERIIYER
jgi:hypothetical protein